MDEMMKNKLTNDPIWDQDEHPPEEERDIEPDENNWDNDDTDFEDEPFDDD